ncbi:MAG: hypothetical protein A3H96_16510 [Acidobacteria bacterium RIFCSPLOWO2_02_FULL_67_36]|nr:MAG: hypothetical protein A3H96_16510 [Acidobacteria bacterium RIFCSPLOWO2_02_FULL_67_36]OFW20766.1 MAG: hypothetical protein A3G21_22710 [Acidobacteria bacterium RIFCSPLOWO2_12_FULL_66_21]
MYGRISLFVSSLALVALMLPSAALAQDPRDVRIADGVSRTLAAFTQLTIFDDVTARVEERTVTLTGKVTMPYKRKDLEARVARLEGVRQVRNDIAVLPVSAFDDDLRIRVARAIYGNPSFWNYAAMADPPIHILVERGHVTLTGVVNSNVDRMLARSLATGLGGLSVTNALRTDQEVAARKATN